MNVRSIAGLGAALHETAGAVYQHNQSDLEFLLATPPGSVQHQANDAAGATLVAARTPGQLSIELMFDCFLSGRPPLLGGSKASTQGAIKGSTVNINLVAPTGADRGGWEGPDYDACASAR